MFFCRNGRLALPALALLVLAGVALPARAGDREEEKKVEKKSVTVAHIKLTGSLHEGVPPADPIFGGISENFKDKIDRIRKARDDKDISALYLEIEGVGLGWGKLDELSRAIADFRKSGKKAFAYLEAGDSKDYLVALSCDEVCVPEPGWLMLTGVRAEVTFYKGLFKKIGVQADMLRMGEAKTAAEPFTRESLSPASRKQYEGVVNDYYLNGMVERIVKLRAGHKLTADKVKELIDRGPYTARAAHKAGLIDRVAYVDAYKRTLKAALKAEEVKIVKDYAKKKGEDIDLSSLSGIMKLFSRRGTSSSKEPKIAVIYAVGAITTGKSRESLLAGETCGSDTIIKAIRQAEQDKTVKAIVLRVDSPGGSALASDLMWNELVRCKKPVVASMSDVAASGGYYISMGARKIYAEPGTLTGSIGVLGGKLALGGLYKKIGLTTEVISRGANSGIFSLDQPFTESEREALTVLMKDVYDQFLDKALAGRKKAGQAMTRDQLVRLAGGRIWTGRQAKENGLIDELGTLEDAVAAAKKMANMDPDKETELLLLPKSKGFLDALLDKGDTRAPDLDLRALEVLRKLPGAAGKLSGAATLLQLRAEPVWLLEPYQVQVRLSIPMAVEPPAGAAALAGGSRLEVARRRREMQIQLPAELEALVQQLIDGGHFGSRAEVIEAGLWLLRDQYELYKVKREELRKLIAVGIEQADRGELIDGELVFGKLREKIEKHIGQAP